MAQPERCGVGVSGVPACTYGVQRAASAASKESAGGRAKGRRTARPDAQPPRQTRGGPWLPGIWRGGQSRVLWVEDYTAARACSGVAHARPVSILPVSALTCEIAHAACHPAPVERGGAAWAALC